MSQIKRVGDKTGSGEKKEKSWSSITSPGSCIGSIQLGDSRTILCPIVLLEKEVSKILNLIQINTRTVYKNKK